MDFQLYTEVILQADVPDENLWQAILARSSIATTVAGLEPGYSIEFFDLLGQTVALATLPSSLLRVPTHSDRPTVRSSALSA
jgi:hypothetical protein